MQFANMSLPFSIISLTDSLFVDRYWPYGSDGCQIHGFHGFLTALASISSSAAVAWDRYHHYCTSKGCNLPHSLTHILQKAAGLGFWESKQAHTYYLCILYVSLFFLHTRQSKYKQILQRTSSHTGGNYQPPSRDISSLRSHKICDPLDMLSLTPYVIFKTKCQIKSSSSYWRKIYSSWAFIQHPAVYQTDHHVHAEFTNYRQIWCKQRAASAETVAGTEPMQRHDRADRAQQPLCATHRHFGAQETFFLSTEAFRHSLHMIPTANGKTHSKHTRKMVSLMILLRKGCWLFCSAIFAGIQLRQRNVFFHV